MHRFLLFLAAILLLAACNSEPAKPKAQQDLNAALVNIAQTYKSGDTQAQKDAKKKEAVEDRNSLLADMAKAPAFDGWICKVEDVRKPAMSKQDELQLVARCDFFTLYNFVDTGDAQPSPQQILSGSPLYPVLMSFKKGDTVRVSGTYQIKDGKAFETSLTVKGGVEEPELAVIFSAVQAVK